MENVAGKQGGVNLKKFLHRSLSTFKCRHYSKSELDIYEHYCTA